MESVGFIGLGVMGTPMALNLVRAGTPLVVWNRTEAKCAPLVEAGAKQAATAADVFDQCGTVILMLSDEAATDAVLDRAPLRGKTVVQMGTLSAEYSAALHKRIADGGGAYVEAPVSGSRGPAEDGALIAMVAGERDITSLLEPMCAKVIHCGEVPQALLMKFAVNLHLITMVTGLAEAFHYAQRLGLDTDVLAEVLDAGPMASSVSRAKVAKLRTGEYSVQAACVDVLKNNQLIAEAARTNGIPSPLLDVCHQLFAETVALGRGGDDMAAVIAALRER